MLPGSFGSGVSRRRLGRAVNALAVSGKTGVGSVPDYLQSVRQAGGKGATPSGSWWERLLARLGVAR